MTLRTRLSSLLAGKTLAASACLCALLATATAQAQTPAPAAAPPGAPPPGAPPDAKGPPSSEPPPGLAPSPLLEPAPAATSAPAATTQTEPTAVEPAPLAAEPPPPVLEEESAPPRRAPNPFARGSKSVTLMIGTGSTVYEQYMILGLGLGFFVADGLKVGVDYEMWFLGDPVMHRLSPELRYILHMVPTVKPYVGTFYRHTFVTGGYDDLDYVGGRVGVMIVPPNARTFVGGGAVYERLLDCEDDSFVDCDSVYPEVTFGISF